MRLLRNTSSRELARLRVDAKGAAQQKTVADAHCLTIKFSREKIKLDRNCPRKKKDYQISREYREWNEEFRKIENFK